MTTIENKNALLLPPGTRLFHIGPPKTGSTALQNAARNARKIMYNNGVYFPGNGRNHREAVYAMMGEINEVYTIPRVPPISHWNDLLDKLNSEPNHRAFITHESAAGSSMCVIRRFIDALGPERSHIAITLRSPADILSSWWIEKIKKLHSVPFESWLRQIYDKDTDQSISEEFRRCLNQGEIVERWAAAVGPENVTVIVADKSNKNLLLDTFEQLLGLPQFTLTNFKSSGSESNRSMSLWEAEIFRRLNLRLENQDFSWGLHRKVIQIGAVQHVLRNRTPDTHEPRVRLPKWAAEQAIHEGEIYANQIRQSGVNLVGDLKELYSCPTVIEDGLSIGNEAYEKIIDTASEALYGAFRGAAKAENEARKSLRRKNKELVREKDNLASESKKLETQIKQLKNRIIRSQTKNKKSDERRQIVACSFSTRDLIAALVIRLKHKIRTGKTKALK